jgi:hypothetical protein
MTKLAAGGSLPPAGTAGWFEEKETPPLGVALSVKGTL